MAAANLSSAGLFLVLGGLLAMAGCSTGELRPGPAPPESCPAGMTMVCTETMSSKLQRKNSKSCQCRQVTAVY